MKRRGLHKQHALAHSLGVNESTITRWKNDGPMSLESAAKLCRVLDMSMDWFVYGTGAMEQHKLSKTSLQEADERLLAALNEARGRLSSRSMTLLASFIDSVLP
jgi:plasmid maintenance system antidote protein VapI